MNSLRKEVCEIIFSDGELIKLPRLLSKDELGDVRNVRRGNSLERYTNIKWVYGDKHPNADFEWGYSGQGPYDFAINILMHFTGHDTEFSEKYAVEFREKFVHTLPRKSGRIKKEDIINFIKERQP